MSKILKIGVTGATGLLGGEAMKALVDEGYQVKALYRTTIPSGFTEVEWIQGDILDISIIEEFVKDCDFVLHCAAKVSYKKKDKRELYDINIQGTENIVNSLLDYPDKKLIHISSVAALGRQANKLLSEKSEWSPKVTFSHYGKSKMLSEMVVYRGIAEGLEAMILAPSFILAYSPSFRSSSDFWSQIEKVPTLAPAGSNGFVDIQDVIQAILKSIQYFQSNEKFIITSHNVPYVDLYAGYTGLPKSKIRSLSRRMLMVIYPFLKSLYFIIGKNSEVSRGAIDTSSQHYSYDNSKSKEVLGIQYTPLNETLQRIKKEMESNK